MSECCQLERIAALVAANPRVGATASCCREHVDDRGEFRVVDTPPDHSPVGGLLGRELSPSSVRPSARALPTRRGKAPGAARVRNQPQSAKRLYEARRARRHDQVARERDVRARTGGDAIHRRDHRHRQLLQGQYQRFVVALDRVAQIGALRARRHGPVREVLARAKSAARAAQHQHPRALSHARSSARAARPRACAR